MDALETLGLTKKKPVAPEMVAVKDAGPYSWARRAAGLRDAVEVQRGLVEEKQRAIDALMRGPIGDVAAARAALENDLRPLVAHLNWLVNEQAYAASMVGGETEKAKKDHATDALASEIFEVEGQLSEARASQAVLRTHIREAEADSAAWDRTISVLERRLAELEAKYEDAADREVGYRESKTKDAAYYSGLAKAIQEQKQLIQNLETVLWVDLRSPSFRSLAESEKDEIVRKTQAASEALQRAKRDLVDMMVEWDGRPAEYKSGG